jgi:hypothetical protein
LRRPSLCRLLLDDVYFDCCISNQNANLAPAGLLYVLRVLEMAVGASGPASAPAAPNDPGGRQEQQEREAREHGPRRHPGRRPADQAVARQEGLREVPQGQHEGPDARVVLDLHTVLVNIWAGVLMRARKNEQGPGSRGPSAGAS